MEDKRLGSFDFYKTHYIICFYDETDEYLEYIFDNCKEILQFMGKEVNRQTLNVLNVRIYRALKNNSIVRFLNNKKLRIHIIDMEDEENESIR